VNEKIFRCSERAASELHAAILIGVAIRAPWCEDNDWRWKISRRGWSRGTVTAQSPYPLAQQRGRMIIAVEVTVHRDCATP
jgi:hypothetical protein